jgi:hypothetical protein
MSLFSWHSVYIEPLKSGKAIESQDMQSSDKSIEQRLQRILHGAFSGPPTPLKDIPTKSGESRKLKKTQRRLRRQRKNRAA